MHGVEIRTITKVTNENRLAKCRLGVIPIGKRRTRCYRPVESTHLDKPEIASFSLYDGERRGSVHSS